MTTSHVPTDLGAPPATPGKRHLRLASQGEVAHTQAGRFSVPLDLRDGPAEPTQLPLILTADEAVQLYEQLGQALAGKSSGGEAE